VKCAGESQFSVIETVSDRELFYFELVLVYIHIFVVVHFQVIMRPTVLTLEMGKLIAATGHQNPNFDAV
jgi:hypothetical protein